VIKRLIAKGQVHIKEEVRGDLYMQTSRAAGSILLSAINA
jgi:hypothetical protein